MHFHICSANHTDVSQDTLAEQVTWLTEGLELHGHKVTYSGSSGDLGSINIFWECFHPDLAHQMVESGAKYGIIASEIADGEGLNNQREDQWPIRWEGFKIAAPKASFIWSLVPESLSVYQKMGLNACYMEYGFSERLLLERSEFQDIDFFFYGGAGQHRQDQINKLAAAGFKSFHPGSIIGSEIRDAILKRSKVVLGLKYTDDWRYTSASRIGRAILAGCAVAHEWTETTLRPANFIPMAPKSGEWIEFAAAVVGKAKMHAESALERYRLEMPIRETMGVALGIVP